MDWKQVIMQLVANNLNLIVVLIFIGMLFILWRSGKKKEVIHVLRYFIAKAEKELGSKTGQIKKGKVIAEFYERMPIVVTFFFTKDDLSEMIDNLVLELDEILKRHENYLENIERG